MSPWFWCCYSLALVSNTRLTMCVRGFWCQILVYTLLMCIRNSVHSLLGNASKLLRIAPKQFEPIKPDQKIRLAHFVHICGCAEKMQCNGSDPSTWEIFAKHTHLRNPVYWKQSNDKHLPKRTLISQLKIVLVTYMKEDLIDLLIHCHLLFKTLHFLNQDQV